MQLSSVLASAIALLAQAASGFYLTTDQELGPGMGPFASTSGWKIGFYKTSEVAKVSLEFDAEGYLREDMDVALYYRTQDSWSLESHAGEPKDDGAYPRIWGPFTIQNRELVYSGGDELVWYLCGDPSHSLEIILGVPGLGEKAGDCIEDVTLRVDEE